MQARPLQSYRLVLAALVVSALVHAAVLVGWPGSLGPAGDPGPSNLSVTLVTAAPPEVSAAPPAQVKPRRKPRSTPKPAFASAGVLAALQPEATALEDFADALPALAPEEPELLPPERLALAQPATPVPALEPPRFPGEALPARLTISYALTSPFADGSAQYTWRRDGDRYQISGRAQAEGFFTLFLEGSITQESRGSITDQGLRPESFVERKPRGAHEGLAFDWEKRSITFSRNDHAREAALTDNTVDWLSMIFQLAHRPPTTDTVTLRVYTQRRLYNFSLKVLGVEQLELPIGTVPALHLRHEGASPAESVDVWLGVEQHYLPVKLRYPVARNRFLVEQVATAITGP